MSYAEDVINAAEEAAIKAGAEISPLSNVDIIAKMITAYLTAKQIAEWEPIKKAVDIR